MPENVNRINETGKGKGINEAKIENIASEAEAEDIVSEAEAESIANEVEAESIASEAEEESIANEVEAENETNDTETKIKTDKLEEEERIGEAEKNNKFNREEIENNCEATARLYLAAAKTAERVVAESYKACVPESHPSFPVDISLVARHYGIKVTSDGLNQSRTQFSRVLAVLICHEDDINVIVDNKVGYKTRRYAMANAIARYLLKDQNSVFTSSYAIPLIPQSLEELSADMIALFMLMPMQLFKEEFKEYIEKLGEHPMDADKWLAYLSDRTQISPFNLAIGYQQMKMALCYERQEQLREGEYMDEEEDPYAVIFA